MNKEKRNDYITGKREENQQINPNVKLKLLDIDF